MKYYIKVVNQNIIKSLGSSKRLPSGATEITKEAFDNYKSILASIPARAGYTKKVTLYVDGTYEVEYVPIVEEEEEE